MKDLFLSVLTAASLTPQPAPVVMPGVSARVPVQSVAVNDWYASGQIAESCQLQAQGTASDTAGADLEIACASDNKVLGNVSAHVAAQGWRQRRITISAEIKVDAMNASLWLKTQKKTQSGNTALMFDDDSEQNLLGSVDADGWQRRVITLPIAADATQVSFGVLLQGAGAVAVRNLQLHISQPGAMAAEVSQMLDTVIAIVKQQTQQRDDLSWQVLEPQLRLFASGAQSAAEVYPAIKYLLSRLHDKHSLLLTPEVAAALNQASASADQAADAHITIFTLPDGARLVLSRNASQPVLRTARNPVASEAMP